MVAKILTKEVWITELNEDVLKSTFNSFLEKSGFKVLGFVEHYFTPFGYTGLWLLAESHFAIHTFPEENKTFIQLSSCSEEKYLNFIKLLKEHNLE